jgi:diguanylate cyclase (GGDEF)-like protein
VVVHDRSYRVLEMAERPGPAGLASASREDLLRYVEILERQALHDPLTGLANRALLEDRLSQVVAQSRRRGVPCAVLVCDLDAFKEVNDRHGHDAGDAVLVEVAERLQASLRASDSVARLGGDEFVVILPDTDRAGADLVARKLSATTRGLRVRGKRIPVGVSVGVSMYPEDGDDAETLLQGADDSMYGAKGTRRAAAWLRVRKVVGLVAALVATVVFLTGGPGDSFLHPDYGDLGAKPKSAGSPSRSTSTSRGLLSGDLERTLTEPGGSVPLFDGDGGGDGDGGSSPRSAPATEPAGGVTGGPSSPSGGGVTGGGDPATSSRDPDPSNDGGSPSAGNTGVEGNSGGDGDTGGSTGGDGDTGGGSTGGGGDSGGSHHSGSSHHSGGHHP